MSNLVKLDYTTKKIVVSKNNVDELFNFQTVRRRIRSPAVKKLVRVLESGKSFPRLSVNKNSHNGKANLLDGNHRHEALLIFLEENPEKKVEINLDIYDLADEEMEKQKFRELNDSVTVSTDDLLQQYKEEPFIKKLLDLEKVSIYGSQSRPLKARSILNAYFDAIKPNFTPSSYTGLKLINRCQNTPASQVDVIKAFIIDYENCFGDLEKGSIFMRTTALNGFFRIWYQNINHIPFDKMMTRFRKVINHSVVIRDTANGGALGTAQFVEAIVSVLNRQRGHGYNRFLIENEDIYSL